MKPDELKSAINQICADKDLDSAMLIETLEEAVKSSVLRRYGEDIEVEVNYNKDTGDIEVYQFKTVVEDDDIINEDKEIEYSEAVKHDPSVQIEDEMGFRIKIDDLGRIAAQSAKQVIIQRLRDAEQSKIYRDYKERIGEIASGTIQRRDKGGWIVNIDRIEAILPRDEQIPKEHFRRGDTIQALITDVQKECRGPQITLSRAHNDYMRALFRREVPEVDEGLIQIMGIARDPGSRAKVAVFSREPGIDPVGACVGVRGARIQNIVQELRSERIDIVIWSPDIATYAKNALAPALVNRIDIDEAGNVLEVVVPDDQLTNAIGRKGQNVKLAARLLGWKIDIFTDSRYKEVGSMDRQGMELLASAAGLPLRALINAGYTTREGLRAASDDTLKESLALDDARLAELRRAIDAPFEAPLDAPLTDAPLDAPQDTVLTADAAQAYASSDAHLVASQAQSGETAGAAGESTENSGTENAG